MPEGDTIAWAANRIRPVLEGRVPDSIETPQPRHGLDRWPERLAGRAVRRVDTHGKHLFLRFDARVLSTEPLAPTHSVLHGPEWTMPWTGVSSASPEQNDEHCWTTYGFRRAAFLAWLLPLA